ncbi:MAG: hypothetical protein ACJ8EB_03115 [Allosphingosinicella sp.]
MASSAYPAGEGGVDLGRTLGRAFATIGSHPGVTLGIAFLFAALPLAAMDAATRLAPRADFSSVFVGIMVIAVVGAFLAFLLQFITQGALMRVTVRAAVGERASFADAAATGLKASLPLLALGILSGIAIMFGLILLLVPGIMLWVRWSVAGPALVAERLGPIEALGRSAELTDGARWKVFGLQILLLIFGWIVNTTAVSVMGAVYGGHVASEAMRQGTGLPIAWTIGNALAGTLVAAVGAVTSASLYIELRESKEGPMVDRLAEVFA